MKRRGYFFVCLTAVVKSWVAIPWNEEAKPDSEVENPVLKCLNCFFQSKDGQVVTQIESVVVGMIWFTNRVIKFYTEMPVKVTRS